MPMKKLKRKETAMILTNLPFQQLYRCIWQKGTEHRASVSEQRDELQGIQIKKLNPTCASSLPCCASVISVISSQFLLVKFPIVGISEN